MSYVNHKRARFDYDILETFEAGLVLLGTEVKSIRAGRAKLEGGHIVVRGKEAYLVGISIPPFQVTTAPKGYDTERARKLLLSQKELILLERETEKAGLTGIPLKLYNAGRNIKLEIAIARGKKKADKRESIKSRDVKREIERTLKNQ